MKSRTDHWYLSSIFPWLVWWITVEGTSTPMACLSFKAGSPHISTLLWTCQEINKQLSMISGANCLNVGTEITLRTVRREILQKEVWQRQIRSLTQEIVFFYSRQCSFETDLRVV
jgi:hypothetical protein